MPPVTKNLLGIGFKLMLLLSLPFALTLFLIWGMFLPISQSVMFDHEMGDLSEETTLRGAELADATQTLIKDFQSLARLIEEGNESLLQKRCEKWGARYLLIVVAPTTLENNAIAIAGESSVDRFGTSIKPEANRSFLDFRAEILALLAESPESEQILTSFRVANLEHKQSKEVAPTTERFVFWVGGQIVPPSEDGEERGRLLLMGLGLDHKIARMTSTPRHMVVMLDQTGDLVLNPYHPQRVATETGEFDVTATHVKEPFPGVPYLNELAAETHGSLVWESQQIEELLLPFQQLPNFSNEGLALPETRRYYFWESAPADLTPRETELALSTLRKIALELASREWASQAGEEFELARVGGLSSRVSSLRLLASSPQKLRELRKRCVEEIEVRFKENKDDILQGMKKMKKLREEPINPVTCSTCQTSSIRVPLAGGGDVTPEGVIISRAVFSEEVKAALGVELNESAWYGSILLVIMFTIILYSGQRMGALLNRMANSAEAVSTLTFDDQADVSHWTVQVDEVSETLPTDRKDEIGVLANSFKKMLADILQSQVVLRDLNRDLEHRVQQRTEQLELANVELIRARDTERELSRSKDEFLANISHELRTPLNWLYGSVQFLEMTALDEQQKGDVETIRKATEDLRDLIEDILDYQKIVMNGMTIEIDEIKLEPLLSDVWDSMKSHAQKFGSDLEFSWPNEIGWIYADRKRLKQVIKNLSSNACKFRDPDGERLNRVEVSARREVIAGREEICITVSDTGRGMKKSEQEKLFTRFQKLSAREGNSSGTGLGLVISRSLVELMHGTLSFESEFGRGTTFTVRLPAVPLDRPPAKHDTSALQPTNPRSTSPLAPQITEPLNKTPLSKTPLNKTPQLSASARTKILVVDDDPNVREMMTRYLEEHGYDVIAAADGVAALGLVKKEAPDLITLDVVMPELDGWAVLAALKTDVETADVPVVMTTTLDAQEKGFALGADDYLLKPLDWSHLERTLQRFCSTAAKRSILLIEDDEETRKLMRRQLAAAGWDVTEATDGKEGLESLTRERPEIILLDLMMPVMDGFEFLIEMEKHPEYRDLPVIVVTAKDPTSEEVEKLNGTVARVLQKGSYQQNELLEEIRRRLDRHAQTRY